MTHHPMPFAARQQLLALGLSALVTAGVLSGLLGLAGHDSLSPLAKQLQHRSQAAATVPATALVSPV